jgi:NTP pyrophosphatase (non-canonical NTP hydrolase)
MQNEATTDVNPFEDLSYAEVQAQLALPFDEEDEAHPSFFGSLNFYATKIYKDNHTWWHDLKTGEKLNRNKGELLMLIVSEVAEAMEGERKDLYDTHLPHRKMAEVELADVLIRIFDYAGAFGYDLTGAVAEKLAYNKKRADHKPEARLAANGKKF